MFPAVCDVDLAYVIAGTLKEEFLLHWPMARLLYSAEHRVKLIICHQLQLLNYFTIISTRYYD